MREDALVDGCLLATYITFDISPELSAGEVDTAAVLATIPSDQLSAISQRVADIGLAVSSADLEQQVCAVWPAMQKMLVRDRKYAAARAAAFTTAIGQAYHRELSVDELPGLTSPETLAIMLAITEVLDMPVQFVAPAFGFQKNFPFDDQAELDRRIRSCWEVCKHFDVSIGFHSGSGKSAENYNLCGAITGGNLEIKTSGRYTYEMGHALAASSDAGDQALWQDWYTFTKTMAVNSSFGENATERDMARSFIVHALNKSSNPAMSLPTRLLVEQRLMRSAQIPITCSGLNIISLYVLTAGGSAEKSALGDHSPAGYQQRARFYAISPEGQLQYAKRVAGYLIFLAETCAIADPSRIAYAKQALADTTSYQAFLEGIASAVSAG